MIPIGDINPRERTPWVNHTLIALNVGVFLLMLSPQRMREMVYQFALFPEQLAPMQLVTHMFLHGGAMHLLGNMIFLWIFGDNVEDRLGSIGYLLFYLASGIVAALGHVLWVLGSPAVQVPMIGASGAISGVVGAYAAFFPQAQIRVFLWLLLPIIHIPAWLMAGIWFAQQLVLGLTIPSQLAGVAFWAHIGGFVAGALFAGLMRILEGAEPLRRRSRGIPGSLRGTTQPVAVPVYHVDQGEEAPPIRPAKLNSWAVLMADDVEPGASAIGAIASTTGLSPAQVRWRLRLSHGVAVRGVPHEAAEETVRRLRRLGVVALAVPDDPSTAPPRPILAQAAQWDETALRLRTEAGDLALRWNRPVLILAARVRETELVDIFPGLRQCLRVTDRTQLGDSRSGPLRLRQLARAILEFREGAILNPGVRVLAGGGHWGYLEFPDGQSYEDYAFWVLNLLRAQSPSRR